MKFLGLVLGLVFVANVAYGDWVDWGDLRIKKDDIFTNEDLKRLGLYKADEQENSKLRIELAEASICAYRNMKTTLNVFDGSLIMESFVMAKGIILACVCENTKSNAEYVLNNAGYSIMESMMEKSWGIAKELR